MYQRVPNSLTLSVNTLYSIHGVYDDYEAHPQQPQRQRSKTVKRLSQLSILMMTTAVLVGCSAEKVTFDSVGRSLDVCAGGPTLDGIDVSKWQGTINWDQVAGAGISFAFIRVSDGVNTYDDKFQYNWSEAARVGIIRGVYQFFRPSQDPVAQADLLINEIGGAMSPGDLPPVVDVETNSGLSKTAVAAAMQAWINRIETVLGVSPIIYTSPGLWSSYVNSSAYSSYTLWVAHYYVTCPRMPTGWTSWDFHQYTDSGTVAGINTTSVDMNKFNGTLTELQALTYGTTQTGPVCGDGVCDQGEDNQSCPGDCPTCENIPAGGRVIDDTEVCLQWGGDMQYWRTESAGHAGSLRWTHTVSTQAFNYVRWNLGFDQAGWYRVEAYTPAAWAESEQAKYQVTHAGETTVVDVDQTETDGWTEVGVFQFAAGQGQFIRLEDLTGEAGWTDTRLVVDGLRVTPVANPSGCETIGQSGRTLDQDDPCVQWGGDMQYWRTESDGYGGSLVWTHTVSSQFYNYVEWDLSFAQPGRYRLEAYLPAGWAESEQARYQITHRGSTTTTLVDQTAADGWVEIGEYDFDAGPNQGMRLEDLTGEPGWSDTRLIVDAIRVTLVPGYGGGVPTSGDPEVDGPDGQDMNGDGITTAMACNQSSKSPGAPLWLALPVLFFWLRRRRRA